MAKRYAGWTVGAVAVLGLAQVSGSYFLGKQIEARVPQALEKLSGMQPNRQVEIVSVSATSYDRGWFSSDVTVEYRFKLLGQAKAGIKEILKPAPEDKEGGSTLAFSLDGHIQHGPLVWRGADFPTLAAGGLTTSWSWPEKFRPVLEPSLRGETVASYGGTLGFDGTLEGDTKFVGYEGKVRNADAALAWEPFRSHSRITYTGDGFRTEGQGRSAKLRVELPEATVELRNLRVDAALEGKDGEAVNRESEIRIGKVTGSRPEGDKLFSLSGLHLSSVARSEAGNLRADGSFGFDRLSAEGKEYNNAQLAWEARRLDRAAYRKLQAKAATIQDSSDQPPQQQLAPLLPHLRELLQGSPEIEITELAVDTGSGPIRGQATYRFDGQIEGKDFLGQLNGGSHLKARLEVPENYLRLATRPFARQAVEEIAKQQGGFPAQQKAMLVQRVTAQLARNLVQSGAFRATEDGYRSKIRLEGGEWQVNGQPGAKVLQAFSG